VGNFFYVVLVIQSRNRELAGKEMTKMNNMKLVFSVLFLGGAIGLSGTSMRAEGVISKDVLTENSYCYMKFPAMPEDTAVPALNSSDVIDFYGSCNTDPQGKDEIQTRRVEAQHMFTSNYEE
jgi:hypothetical protein